MTDRFLKGDVPLKVRYNSLLAREQKAEIWMNDPARTDAEVERWQSEFKKILSELNAIIDQLGPGGSTVEERLHGFDLSVMELGNL